MTFCCNDHYYGNDHQAFIARNIISSKLLTHLSEEGREYEFRVFAENEIGESEPLQTARSIIAKNQYSKYPGHLPSKYVIACWNYFITVDFYICKVLAKKCISLPANFCWKYLLKLGSSILDLFKLKPVFQTSDKWCWRTFSRTFCFDIWG